MPESTYPEHEKLSSRKEEHEHIQHFLQFLEAEGYFITEWADSGVEFKRLTPVDLIAEYFDVDPDKLEQEKREMLTNLQNLHK